MSKRSAVVNAKSF